MMTTVVTVTIHCDACRMTATVPSNDLEKTSTLDAITWRAVRDLVMTTTWFRVQFPDGQTFREYHVCGKNCAESLVGSRYRAEKSDVEPS